MVAPNWYRKEIAIPPGKDGAREHVVMHRVTQKDETLQERYRLNCQKRLAAKAASRAATSAESSKGDVVINTGTAATSSRHGSSGRFLREVRLRNLDFSSVHALITTLVSLSVITLIGVGIRLLTMVTIQQRRERMNRQINERLRVLIAAYKTLGGSFTGNLSVDPTHLRDLRRRAGPPETDSGGRLPQSVVDSPGSDRARRVRDAVEAALSDIILLGTEQQVRLAASAAHELAAGKLVHTHELVTNLRAFIREALDLDPIPSDLAIPLQGPARPAASGGREKAEKGEGRQGGGGGGGMGMAGGMRGGFILGSGSHHLDDDPEDDVGAASPHRV